MTGAPPSESSNPYAPPVATDTVAPQAGLWRVEGPDLWVRSGAVFPDLDLTNGSAPERPRMRRVFLHTGGMVQLLMIVVLMMVGGGVLWGVKRSTGVEIPIAVVVVVVAVLCLIFRTSAMVPCVIIHQESLRKARMRWLAAVGVWLGIAGFMVPVFQGFRNFSGKQPWIDHLIAWWIGSFSVSLVFGLAHRFLSGRLHGRERAGDWVRVGGISPKAVDHLRSVAPPQPRSEDPNMRTYVTDLRKFSLMEWRNALGPKPWQWMQVLVAKWLRSPMLKRRSVLRLTHAPVDEEKVSEAFKEEIRGQEGGLREEGWMFVAWDVVVVPDPFGTTVESALFLREDRRTCLLLADVRSVVSSIKAVILHSWLEDGTVLRTSDERAFPVMNPQVEWERLVGADRFTLVSRHIAKAEQRVAISLIDGTDAGERLVALSLANHAWLHAQGICGPLEEISA